MGILHAVLQGHLLQAVPRASSPSQQLCSSAPAGSGCPGSSRGQEVLGHSFLLPPSFLSFLPLSLPNFYFLTEVCMQIVKRVDDFYGVGRPAAPPPCLLPSAQPLSPLSRCWVFTCTVPRGTLDCTLDFSLWRWLLWGSSPHAFPISPLSSIIIRVDEHCLEKFTTLALCQRPELTGAAFVFLVPFCLLWSY